MAKAYESRTHDYSSGDQVASADLDAIQDGIIAVSDAVGDLASMSEDNVIDELLTRSGTLRIQPGSAGEPLAPNGTTRLIDRYTIPVHVRAAALSSTLLTYELDRHFSFMKSVKITNIGAWYKRTSGSAVMTIELVREALDATPTRTVLQSLTVTDSSSTWTDEYDTPFEETLDFDNYNYTLEVTLDCDAATSELQLRTLEVSWEAALIG